MRIQTTTEYYQVRIMTMEKLINNAVRDNDILNLVTQQIVDDLAHELLRLLLLVLPDVLLVVVVVQCLGNHRLVTLARSSPAP